MTFQSNLNAAQADTQQNNIMNSFIQYYVDNEINKLKQVLVDAAPENLDNLHELGEALAAEIARATAAEVALGNEINAEEVARVAAIDLVTAAVQAEQVRAEAAEAAEIAARNAAIVAVADDLNANRIQGDAVLSADLNAEEARVDALIASGMWLYADQAAFPAAADNHGRVVHSHADGAQFFAHGGAWIRLATSSEVTAAVYDDAALAARVSAIENAPYVTEAGLTIVAGDIRTDFENQDSSEQIARIAGDDALSTRVDVLEADPTTKTYVDAQNASYLDKDGQFVSNVNKANFVWNREVRFSSLSNLEIDADSNVSITCGEDYDVTIGALYRQGNVKLDSNTQVTGTLDVSSKINVDTNARVEFADNLTKIHNVLRGTDISIGNNIEMNPAAAGGRVEINGGLVLDASDLTNAANDTAAAAAGIVVGQIYHNNGELRIRIS